MIWQGPCFPVLLAIIGFSYLTGINAKSGSLSFLTKNGKEHHISSKNCSGIFLKTDEPHYECACISGVWSFYDHFCEEPLLFLGGHDYCFGLSSFKKLSQAALIGSTRQPFEPSIGHFQKENFIQLTTSISENEFHEYNQIEVDALGSWITVTNTKWTLYGDQGESICLRPTVPGYRVLCTYNKRLLPVLEQMKWNYIVHVRKGCYSNFTVKADACYPFRRPNEKSNCKYIKPEVMPCPDPDNINDPNPPDPFCELGEPTTELPTTTTPEPRKRPKCEGITRETVKDYWLDPANNQCAKSLNEAILTDQLRRFATTRFDLTFESRLQSLDQMKQLLVHSRDIMKKTCSDDYVPTEFLDVATEAFLMFISEDFFYGVEGIDQLSFDRILKNLKTCWKEAKAFVYESDPLGCDLKKISGELILPDETVDIIIPENAKSKHFEPLIETTWKMLLNAHAYCFEDFPIPNDHHHFSVLFLELFSKTIYEKWIEPLTNMELYKFILPKYSLMDDIMENIDYCVGAAGHVSHCPVWMTRSNPLAKPILESEQEENDDMSLPVTVTQQPVLIDEYELSSSEGIPLPGSGDGDAIDTSFSSFIFSQDDTTQANILPSSMSKRRRKRQKRSTWVRGIYLERTVIWDGEAYCVQNMVDPSRLGLATCSEVF